MRVEIRSAGLVAILICVGLLSGAVFVMGLLAGYDIGHESQVASQQVAASYPLETSPAAQSSAAVASAASVAPATAATAAPGARVAEQKVAPPAPKAATVASRGGTSTQSENESDNDNAADNSATAPPPGEPSPRARIASAAESTPAPVVHRRPYNIQIQAAMDSTSATEMMRRLTTLGYRPHLVPTSINGEKWYKVEVGPYATQAEASAAESALRARYNSQYSRGESAPDAGGDEDE